MLDPTDSGPSGDGYLRDAQLSEALNFVDRELTARLGDCVERQVALSGFTTFRLGGPARLLLRAQHLDHLETLADVMAETATRLGCEVPVVVIGQGSNLLIGDAGFAGVVVHLGGDFAQIEIATADFATNANRATDANRANGATDASGASDANCQHGAGGAHLVIAGGAVKLPVLARKCAAAGYDGLGWMVGVPGSVGGAVRMNAGGHGSDVAANLQSVTVVDLLAKQGERTRIVEVSELALQYRSSAVKRQELVVSATFACTAGDPSELDAELTEIVRWRRANQPGGANCGSVFTNPPNQSTGKLIDDLGMRGFRLSPTATASVSDKHANFIQADPDGRCADVWALIVHLRSAVFERYGTALHPEVQTLGFDPALPPLSSDE